jgi:hypothetical protein
VLLLARDPDDSKREQGDRRVLAHVKSNFGKQAPSLALQIAQGRREVAREVRNCGDR